MWEQVVLQKLELGFFVSESTYIQQWSATWHLRYTLVHGTTISFISRIGNGHFTRGDRRLRAVGSI